MARIALGLFLLGMTSGCCCWRSPNYAYPPATYPAPAAAVPACQPQALVPVVTPAPVAANCCQPVQQCCQPVQQQCCPQQQVMMGGCCPQTQCCQQAAPTY